MSLVLFDLNDYELRLFRDGRLAAASIGCGLIADDRVIFGDAALRRFRLEPRRSNNLYWHRMNLEPLPVAGGGAAHNADLVYLQLGDLMRQGGIEPDAEVVIAAPGSTTPDQLGLLLGITGELGLKVVGLVDAAVATAAPVPVPGELLHLDVSLHRATLTTLAGDAELTRTASENLTELGLVHILDSWMSAIADRFVAQTRFDPLSIAETEQQLYDQVYDWLESPEHQGDIAVVIEHRDNQRRIDTPLSVLAEKAAQRYRGLSRRNIVDRHVLLSHRAARLPGLQRFLEDLGATVSVAAPDQLVQGVEANAGIIRSDPDSLRFVSAVPRQQSARGTSRAATPAGTRAPAQTPTHVLFESDAIAIGDRLSLDRDRQPAIAPLLGSTFPDGHVVLERDQIGIRILTDRPDLVQLNGRPLQEGQRLTKGDRLEIAGHRMTLIRLHQG
jgi:hypothetical protein